MLLAYAQLALSMALVGANVAVAKVLAAALPVPLVVCLRCALASLVVLLLLRWRAGRMPPVPDRRSLLNLLLQAAFGTVLYNLALLAGLRLTTALEGGLVLATLPAVVALGSAVLLGERLPGRQWAATALAAGGMGALTLARESGGGGSLAGNALVFLGVCGEAAYVLLAKRVAGRLPALAASFWMQLFSTALLLPLALPGLGALPALAEPRLAALLVFHSLTASVLCLLLWYAGLRRVPAGLAGVFTACMPATATLVAVLWLGERMTATHAAGFVLMAASLLLATWPAAARREGAR
ncbi:DMT family transporter [Roseomonas sp. NAR14]|uniref:DMT family transporter n=1 Tax=Roseomonas acroporae TaxID=2937791 RepID=A0A9X1YEY5_9PROT|nr:DMT family transporter [Roseomonas acroporae]MCK8787472.1 DMT family transporter [Roseomonas acroporae]